MINLNSPQLDNCPSCGALYLRDQIDRCLACYQAHEAAFKKIEAFLRHPEHRNASLEDVHRFTGVAQKAIADFIREGRILPSDYPNLGYPCAHCRQPIKRHILCETCYRDFTSDAQVILDEAKASPPVDKWAAGSAQYWKMKK